MSSPVITILSAASRVDPQTGKYVCDVVFTSDQTLQAWEARINGVGLHRGLLLAFSKITSWQLLDDLNMTWEQIETSFPTWADLEYDGDHVLQAGESVTLRIDDEGFSGGQTYRINVYGQNDDEEWTPNGLISAAIGVRTPIPLGMFLDTVIRNIAVKETVRKIEVKRE